MREALDYAMLNCALDEEWLTTAGAAELSEYHEHYIRQMVGAGKLEAES